MSDGPIWDTEDLCQQLWMGPLKLLRTNADGVEWAHESYQEVPAMVLDGPTKTTEKCCQWSQIGPWMPLKNATNHIGWAHSI